jgi:putative oxidoreductase
MNKVTVIGKYLFAIPFVIFGIMYLINAEAMTTFISMAGNIVWIYIAGLVMLMAGVTILIGKKDAVATFLLGIMFIIFACFVDLPALIEQGNNETITTLLLRDLIIAGAAFVYCRSAAKDRSWRLI